MKDKGQLLLYSKVEITSLDTSSIKVLTETECNELLRLTRAGDRNARNKLIEGNLKLVLSIVQRFRNRADCIDDLFQVGCIGLIKACDNFDLAQNVKFSTYAVPMIIGEIKRYLRDNSSLHISRSIRDTAYKAMKAKEEIMKKYGREALPGELAELTGIDESKLLKALEAVVEPISLYEPVYSENGDTIYLVDQLGDSGTDTGWIDEISLKDAIKNLDDRDTEILTERYLYGKTQTEVAKELGISQAQISRIEKDIIRRIR